MSIAAPATNPASDLELKLPATIGTAGQVLKNSSTPGTLEFGADAGLFSSLAVLEDQQSTGTEGGTATSGSWVHRTLNTEVYDPDSIVSLTSNQFTIGPGNFFIYFESQSYSAGRNQNRLYNVTDSSVIKYGNNAYGSGGEGVTNVSWGYGRVTISSGTKVFRVEHRVEATMNTYGWGVAFSDGGGNIYTRVVIYKEA